MEGDHNLQMLPFLFLSHHFSIHPIPSPSSTPPLAYHNGHVHALIIFLCFYHPHVLHNLGFLLYYIPGGPSQLLYGKRSVAWAAHSDGGQGEYGAGGTGGVGSAFAFSPVWSS